MASVATMYNTLPSLSEAEVRFTDRPTMMKQVADLLAPYGGLFGLCLIHIHCTLAEGELMLAEGSVSKPVRQSDLTAPYYPDRWLPTGEAFEFTTRPTTEPPAELMAAFRRLTAAIGVLGLYYIGTDKSEPQLERTNGRQNVSRPFTDSDQSIPTTETAWDPTKDDPVTMACVMYCDSTITRTKEYHKKTQSHVPQGDAMVV
ncbi:MAG: hypothetical protein M1826_000146 [Phylliscum demangeonii]|nr:MAG: hypothetical protein M1826_000146 [Phylliscum demangeonii]